MADRECCTYVARMSDDLLGKVQKAYAFDGPAVELGALVVDNEAHPEAPVRLPLAMMRSCRAARQREPWRIGRLQLQGAP